MGQAASVQKPFLTDVKTLRERARKNLDDGAIGSNYVGDVNKTIEILQSVLATELVCILRYKRHYYMAKGIHAESVKPEFLQHAGEEQEHADWIAERITQLGGELMLALDPEAVGGGCEGVHASAAKGRLRVAAEHLEERVEFQHTTAGMSERGRNHSLPCYSLSHAGVTSEELSVRWWRRARRASSRRATWAWVRRRARAAA